MHISAASISRHGISQSGVSSDPPASTKIIFRKRRHAMEYPFAPGVTYTLTPGLSVPDSQQLWDLPTGAPTKRQVRIVSDSVNPMIYVAFGVTGVTATTGSMPIIGGSSEVFTVPETSNYISALSASGAPTLFVTAGFGD